MTPMPTCINDRALIKQIMFIGFSNVKFLLHGGSYMSAHVLLNLLNELGKRDKMRGLPSILSLFSQRV